GHGPAASLVLASGDLLPELPCPCGAPRAGCEVGQLGYRPVADPIALTGLLRANSRARQVSTRGSGTNSPCSIRSWKCRIDAALLQGIVNRQRASPEKVDR